jgi:hypothetical protein
MSGVTTAELVFRLAVAGFVVVGPTLLYLLLWRFLSWLRDDELVERLAGRGVIDDPDPAPADILASTTAGAGATRCSSCGARNFPGAPVCRNCHRDLE